MISVVRVISAFVFGALWAWVELVGYQRMADLGCSVASRIAFIALCELFFIGVVVLIFFPLWPTKK